MGWQFDKKGKVFLDDREVTMDKSQNHENALTKLTLQARNGDTEAAKKLLHQMSMSCLDEEFIGYSVVELKIDEVEYNYQLGRMINAPFSYKDHIGCALCGCIIYPSKNNIYLTNCPYCNTRWVKPQEGSLAWKIKKLSSP